MDLIPLTVLTAVVTVFLVLPPRMLLRYKFSASPQFERLEIDTLPPDAEAYFTTTVATLVEDGFALEAQVYLREQLSKVTPCLFSMVNRTTGDAASISSVYVHNWRRTGFYENTVVIHRKYGSGDRLLTSNSNQPHVMLHRSSDTHADFPGLNNVRRLLRAHWAIAARTAPANGDPVLPEQGREAALFAKTLVGEYEYQVSRGRMRFSASDNTYRFTIVGVYIAVWMVLPPIRQIVSAQRRAAGRKLLLELRV